MGTKDTGIVHSALGAQMTGLVHPGSRHRKAGFMGLTMQSRGRKLKSIKFLLYTNNTEAPVEIDVDRSLSAIDTKLDTKVLIHGCHGDPTNYKYIIAAYLARGNVNVIAVNWTSLSKNMDYTDSKSDTEVTGTRVAQLLDILADNGLDLSRVNCVGHSLGAQTAGVVGDRLTKGVLGLITGLDPAGPLFDYITPKKNKLDLKDAAYVQIIHTNLGKLGSVEMAGHSDLMPNGGIKQPNCEGTEEIIGDHVRVLGLWEETIKGHEPLIGHQCSSWDVYENGKCDTNPEAVMGEKIDQSSTEGLQTRLKVRPAHPTHRFQWHIMFTWIRSKIPGTILQAARTCATKSSELIAAHSTTHFTAQ
uniref:Lipase domain-containing protein n=1 Tax=Timema genevievae TaxID=629358 RepID=A0A7R9K0U1_TIMGE|nr:unnamed protein product [Timema genevievae]